MTTKAHFSKPQGKIPNDRFPLLVRRNAIPSGRAEAVKDCLRCNGWGYGLDVSK